MRRAKVTHLVEVGNGLCTSTAVDSDLDARTRFSVLASLLISKSLYKQESCLLNGDKRPATGMARASGGSWGSPCGHALFKESFYR